MAVPVYPVANLPYATDDFPEFFALAHQTTLDAAPRPFYVGELLAYDA